MSASDLSKDAQTDYPIHELFGRRWSPRSFSAREIETELVGSLMEAARWAPSSRNQQPWRFVLAERRDEKDHARLVEVLMEGNQTWARNAPLLIIGVAKKTWDHNGEPNSYAWYDLGQSVAQMVAQATALGLHVHQMGGFFKDKAQEALEIPEDHQPVVAIAVGYLDSPEKLPETLAKRELAERVRKPLSELVFRGKWDVSWHKEA